MRRVRSAPHHPLTHTFTHAELPAPIRPVARARFDTSRRLIRRVGAPPLTLKRDLAAAAVMRDALIASRTLRSASRAAALSFIFRPANSEKPWRAAVVKAKAALERKFAETRKRRVANGTSQMSVWGGDVCERGCGCEGVCLRAGRALGALTCIRRGFGADRNRLG